MNETVHLINNKLCHNQIFKRNAKTSWSVCKSFEINRGPELCIWKRDGRAPQFKLGKILSHC